MLNTLDSKSSVLGRAGSIPALSTKAPAEMLGLFYFNCLKSLDDSEPP